MRFLLLLLTITVCCFGYEVIEDQALIPILTPSLAERKIAKIRLENGLEAYLISDPGSYQSAAALSIEAGSWQDPKEYPGMAHFLEHMLFLGTVAFPKEDDFSNFVHDHGGEDNAFTSTDRTIYIFSADHGAFPDALERFSHFFINPLLSPSGVERELHAVDEEYFLHRQEDGWRKWMIFKETGNPQHPNRAFCIGNAQTLQGIPHQALRDWHTEHYRAGQMHLAILSSLPLEDLTSLAEHFFAKIAPASLPSSSYSESISSENQQGKIIYVQPVSGDRRLELIWELPQKFAADREHGVVKAVGCALAQTTQNGLSYFLKSRGLIEGLHVDFNQVSKDHLLLSIDFSLTEKGVEDFEKVALSSFQAIAGLKERGIPRYFFEELASVSLAGYQFQSRFDTFETVLFHADHLVEENLESYPERTAIPTPYNPESLAELLNSLTPDACIFMLTADQELTGVAYDSIESWTQAAYRVQELPVETLELWAQARPHSRIALPQPNPFLPHPKCVERRCTSEPPALIIDEPTAQIYFGQDCHYLVPELAVLLRLHSPLLNSSEDLVNIYLRGLREYLSTLFHFAREAGIDCLIFHERDALKIEISGFSDQVPLFLKQLLQALPQFRLSQSQFEKYKEMMIAAEDEDDSSEAEEILSSLLLTSSEQDEEESDLPKEITFEDYENFTDKLFQELSIQGLFYGDAAPQEILSLWKEVSQNFSAAPYFFEKKEPPLISFPEERIVVEIEDEQPDHCAILALYLGDFSLEARAAHRILSKALEEAFFDALRTKQQTGYLVKSWDSVVQEKLFQFFSVQSSHYTGKDLLERYDVFLKNFRTHLAQEIPPSRFETIKQSTIAALQAPADNLSVYVHELFYFLFEKNGDFSFRKRSATALQELTYENFLSFADEFLILEKHAQIAVLIENQE